MEIAGQKIGPGHPCFVIAELSANHNQNYDQAIQLVEAAAEAGANAIKLQTYTPDTITLDSDQDAFLLKDTIWAGKTLHQIYAEAYTPWEWHEGLKKEANDRGLPLFSSPFDLTAVDFLEKLGVPAYKIASFELVDIPLIEKAAATGQPMVVSTGMASLGEIEEGVNAARAAGATEITLLKCTSAYPAAPESMNLRTIPNLAEVFGVPVGLSDHTLGIAAPVAAVSLGASVIEKHLTLSRDVEGPDSAFSLEPDEFREMVDSIRLTEQALGVATYGCGEAEQSLREYRRSLFVVEDLEAGAEFSEANVRSIRPATGLAPKHYSEILGKRASCAIGRGTPLNWEMVSS